MYSEVTPYTSMNNLDFPQIFLQTISWSYNCFSTFFLKTKNRFSRRLGWTLWVLYDSQKIDKVSMDSMLSVLKILCFKGLGPIRAPVAENVFGHNSDV